MVELVLGHGLVAVGHLPGPGGALADDLDQRLDVEARAAGEVQPFGERLHQPRDANLVDHLRHLPGARGAKEAADAGIGGDDWFGAVVIRLRAAAHDRKHAVFRPGLTAGDGGVDKADAAVAGHARKLAGDGGGDGGVIGKDGAGRHAREGAVIAKADRAEVVIIADAGHDERGPLCGLGGRRGGAAGMALYPAEGLFGRTVVDRDLMPLGGQMPRHRKAHHAQAKKCHLRHRQPPCALRPFANCPS